MLDFVPVLFPEKIIMVSIIAISHNVEEKDEIFLDLLHNQVGHQYLMCSFFSPTFQQVFLKSIFVINKPNNHKHRSQDLYKNFDLLSSGKDVIAKGSSKTKNDGVYGCPFGLDSAYCNAANPTQNSQCRQRGIFLIDQVGCLIPLKRACI